MTERRWAAIASDRVTPPEVFFERRKFISAVALGMLGAAPLFGGGRSSEGKQGILDVPLERPDVFPSTRNKAFSLPKDVDQRLTPRKAAATHNNFYEFLPGKGGPVWKDVEKFQVEPWKVEVSGECERPQTFDLDDLFAFEHEERLYHFRCVERWAMNVPWSGFPLSKLLEKVQPTSSARFVRFSSAFKPSQMPGLKKAPFYPWPYHEALRMDEAMNELTLLATGVYGSPLLKQHGSPVRLLAPWKYGYKSPKSITKIELLTKQPGTFWQVQPHEYGFISNVNPYIPHPRWSQAISYWLDTEERFVTPIFNGYGKYVAQLYTDEPRTLQRPLRKGQTAR